MHHLTGRVVEHEKGAKTGEKAKKLSEQAPVWERNRSGARLGRRLGGAGEYGNSA